MTLFRVIIRWPVGPIGYCGSKAAMRTLAQADVVLALGTFFGLFGTLPQYGLDYWPKQAKLIQVDVNARVPGLSSGGWTWPARRKAAGIHP